MTSVTCTIVHLLTRVRNPALLRNGYDEQVEHFLAKRAATSDCVLLAAYMDGLLCGHADVSLSDAARGNFVMGTSLPAPTGQGVAYIANVTVDVAFRRKGVGTALVKEAECIAARAEGITAAALHANAGDEGARELYRKLGYRVIAVDSLLLAAVPGTKRRVLMQKSF